MKPKLGFEDGVNLRRTSSTSVGEGRNKDENDPIMTATCG